ncbi:MAG: YncE family protein [Gemmatimonadaceae bacterium]
MKLHRLNSHSAKVHGANAHRTNARTIKLRHQFAVALVATAVASVQISAQQFATQKFNVGGAGGTDYVAVNPDNGWVYVSRGTHVMVVDGLTGNVLADIPDTPRVHGIAFAAKEGHGFTTNAGDSTLTMFNLADNTVIKKVHIGIDGADGIWYDEGTNRIFSINHSKPTGSVVSVDAKTGDVLGKVMLAGEGPEGGASDGNGLVFINIEDKNSIDVLDINAMKVIRTWSIEPCDGPTGIAYDKASNRIFSGCSNKSVVVDATTGKVVATIANGDGVDALGWDATEKLMYIPSGRSGNITVVHQDSPYKYTVVSTIKTASGGKTIAVDPTRHRAYVLALEYGPAPAPAAGAAAPTGRGGARGPLIGTAFFAVSHPQP